jgi:hypothetical protein
MQVFGRHWDPLELIFATSGLLMSVAAVLVPADAQVAAALLTFGVGWVIRKARTTYVL